MSDGFFVLIMIEVGREFFRRLAAHGTPAVDDMLGAFFRRADGKNFNPVACGKNERFGNGIARLKGPCFRSAEIRQGKLLADFNRSRAMIQTYKMNIIIHDIKSAEAQRVKRKACRVGRRKLTTSRENREAPKRPRAMRAGLRPRQPRA